MTEAVAAIQAAGPANMVSLKLFRDGQHIKLAITLGASDQGFDPRTSAAAPASAMDESAFARRSVPRPGAALSGEGTRRGKREVLVAVLPTRGKVGRH